MGRQKSPAGFVVRPTRNPCKRFLTVAGEQEQPLLVLGIMSGTSIDAVDYALCKVGLGRVRLLQHWQTKFPKQLQKRLHVAAANQATSYELGQCHHDLGRFYASEAKRGLRGQRVQLAGLHGQTVFHSPDRKHPATLQLGEPAYLAEVLHVPVVSNFRAADIAAGGLGAPLATLFHQIAFGKPGSHVCVNNLGGISNVTSIDWRVGRKPRLLAFDTGPANVLIDLAVRQFSGGRRACDRSGAWAARGQPRQRIVECWLEHSFFHTPPPKSTGRELFGEPFFNQIWRQISKLSPHDALATFVELTARSLALNYQLHLPAIPDLVVLTGGGAANRHLVSRIRERLRALHSRVSIQTSDELGWPIQSVEPAAFALLAYYRWRRKPGNIAATTGARRFVLLGQIAEP
jgi:anhydro-N-acetylmuramic acid kinase